MERDNSHYHVYGKLRNEGNQDAKNVIVKIDFYNENGLRIARQQIELGDIAAGEQRDYDGKFVVGWIGSVTQRFNLEWD